MEYNEIKKRDYYTGHLPKKDRLLEENKLGLTRDQIKHPLVLDINEKIRELNITNVTHGSKLFRKNLEPVGIDPEKKSIVYIKEFNKTIEICSNKEGKQILKALEKVTKNTKEKNPVINMKEFTNKLEKQVKDEKIEINLKQESKIEFIDKIQEMIKNIKD